MKKKLALGAMAIAVSISGRAVAGEMEFFSAGAEHAFLNGVSVENLQTVPAPAAQTPASEYKKLAAAFEKGTAPGREELSGWHAGRVIEEEFPEYPGSILLAGGEPQGPGDNGRFNDRVYKLVPLTLDGSADFYETMSMELAESIKIVIKESQAKWTPPRFSAAGVTFEKIMAAYEKGFSRYEVRKSMDNRILLKHTWSSDLGGTIIAGTSYAFFTKNVTPQ